MTSKFIHSPSTWLPRYGLPSVNRAALVDKAVNITATIETQAPPATK